MMKRSVEKEIQGVLATVDSELTPLRNQLNEAKREIRDLEKDMVMKDERLVETENFLK